MTRSGQTRRQFRQLTAMSYRRLLDTALASRDVDSEQFVIWTAALMATFPLFYAFYRVSAYEYMLAKAPEALKVVALTDRLFFVVWSMVMALLLAAVSWEALLPDRSDRQVLGVLPVGSRTVAAARAFASLTGFSGFVAAINVPAALFYAAVGSVHPMVGTMWRVLPGHLLATTAAGVFTVSVVIVLRVLLLLVVRASVATRVAMIFQVVVMFLLVDAFIFLPGLLKTIAASVIAGGESANRLPPLWFLGILVSLGGPYYDQVVRLAPLGVLAALVAPVVAMLTVVATAPIIARQVIEATSPARSLWSDRAPRAIVAAVVHGQASQAIVRFVLTSLARSRRHLLIVVSYAGVGVAIVAGILTQSLPVGEPASHFVALPLVMMYFLVGGLRAAFAVPTDVAANWTFRIAPGASLLAYLKATRVVLLLLGVVPVSVVFVGLAFAAWGASTAVSLFMMCLVSGVALCELALLECHGIPFTRARVVLPSTIKVGVFLSIAGLYLFAAQLSVIQIWALASPLRVAAYLVALAAAAYAAGVVRRRRRQGGAPTFEAPSDDEVLLLKLSTDR